MRGVWAGCDPGDGRPACPGRGAGAGDNWAAGPERGCGAQVGCVKVVKQDELSRVRLHCCVGGFLGVEGGVPA